MHELSNLQLRQRGLIFRRAEFPDAYPGGGSFAQSPQALVLNDYIRIYFSTRTKDENGQFLSHVSYADFNSDLSRILDVADRRVIPLGSLGTFDEHGIFPFSPLRTNDHTLAYTCGWSRRASVPVETAVGIAISDDDGKSFRKPFPGPILAASPSEPFLVGDAFVRIFDDLFHMWYIFGTSWQPDPATGRLERNYKIGHTTSRDGFNWSPCNGRTIVPTVLGEAECQALPTVICKNGIYHLFFCYRHTFAFRENPANAYRIGYATSKDLLNWQRQDARLEKAIGGQPWDDAMQCYPHVFEAFGKCFLLYNGNRFGAEGFGAVELIWDDDHILH